MVNTQADVVCVGQALVDCITRGRETEPYKKNVYRAESISLSTGGDALNEAMVLAEIGYKVRLVCGLGQDLAGKLVMGAATGRGIDTGWITQRESLHTPIANLMVQKDGSRQSVNSMATMLDGYIPEGKAVENVKIVSFASLFRAPLDQKEVVVRLMKAAKDAGAIICADTKMPTFRNMHLEDLAEILPMIDYIFPNESEAAYYTGESDYMSMAQKIHQMGVKHVIVKTGKEGCTVCSASEKFSLSARKAEVVDSTGAGDNFVAGFISGILQGANLRECCESALDQAAICVGHLGAVRL